MPPRLKAVSRFRPFLGVGALAFLVVGMLVVMPLLAPSILWPDQPAPTRVQPYVSSARGAIQKHVDGLKVIHFRLDSVRCRSDGAVVLLFSEEEFPYVDLRHAYAMSGVWPPTGWSVGLHLSDGLTDPEVQAFLAAGESSCE